MHKLEWWNYGKKEVNSANCETSSIIALCYNAELIESELFIIFIQADKFFFKYLTGPGTEHLID